MSLSDLFWLFPVAFIAYGLWQHGTVSAVAREAARRHCRRVGVQFLDQTVVLKKLAILPSRHTLFYLQRQYNFEFSSLGDVRYRGSIRMRDRRVEGIELEPFKTL